MTQDAHEHDDGDDLAPGSIGARCVWALFEREEVPKRQYRALVGDILGLSYSQARRKLSGESPWTLEELQLVAERFDLPLSELVGGGERVDLVDATLQWGSVRLPCRVKLGPPAASGNSEPFLATKSKRDVKIVALPESVSAGAFTVEKLVFTRAAGAVRAEPRIAVLDDDEDMAEIVAANLRDRGFEVEPFVRGDQLRQARKRHRFDAYVVDWLLGDGSAQQPIEEIREEDPHCPIVVLTGELGSGPRVQSAVSAAYGAFDLVVLTKPVEMEILAATLEQGLAQAKAKR